MQRETHMHRLQTFHCTILYRQTIKNRIIVWLCPTFSLFSKSSLKAHSLRRAGSSVMEARVSRNCSALPSGMSGFATWASWIFDLSSSVGSIVNSFCSNKNNVSASHLWYQYPQQISLCVYAVHLFVKAESKLCNILHHAPLVSRRVKHITDFLDGLHNHSPPTSWNRVLIEKLT